MRRQSSFLSLVLRHDPARAHIILDDAGWTDVEALLAGCAAQGVVITRAELEAIVAGSDKQRFALSPDGTRIRANQGHSVPVDLQLEAAVPPATLYHGTVAAALPGIRAKGLDKGARHAVHLSADRTTATAVGGRRGAPVVLAIFAGAMHEAGHGFQRSANGVWLTEHVPVAFIAEPPAPRADVARRGDRAAIARATVAACDAGHYTSDAGARVELRAAIDDAADATIAHDLQHDASLARPARAPNAAPARLVVTDETTVAALIRLADAYPDAHLGCLNFASAKNPGGGFLGGAQAQEEALARSSALYPCLLTQPQHYARNRANPSALYLDLALFSPRVPVFRDDDGGWLAAPVLASIITCAAPNASALRQQHRFDAAAVETALRRRAAFVLAIAAHHSIERLVLGAWGAGVFGNDPAMVAAAFADALRADASLAAAFVEIIFAVPGGTRSANHDAFAAAFAAT